MTSYVRQTVSYLRRYQGPPRDPLRRDFITVCASPLSYTSAARYLLSFLFSLTVGSDIVMEHSLLIVSLYLFSYIPEHVKF